MLCLRRSGGPGGGPGRGVGGRPEKVENVISHKGIGPKTRSSEFPGLRVATAPPQPSYPVRGLSGAQHYFYLDRWSGLGGVPRSRCGGGSRLGRKRWIFDELPGRRRCSGEKSKFRENPPGTIVLSLQRSKNRSTRRVKFRGPDHLLPDSRRPAGPRLPDMLCFACFALLCYACGGPVGPGRGFGGFLRPFQVVLPPEQ